ncbi:MAG: hypothetical protein EA422_02785 [Gemmatimonadales bacterium]|nr:MAG: hypothetical protein EA422_02785 [Gemmatimonadales bacterium]
MPREPGLPGSASGGGQGTPNPVGCRAAGAESGRWAAAAVTLGALALLLLTALPQSGLEAQIPPPRPGELERQTLLLPEAGILEITPTLRARAGLFPDLRDFQGARLFQGEDGALVVEVAWLEEGRLVRQRRPLSEAELAALRRTLAESLARAGAAAVDTQDGRGGLVLGHTLLGVAYHGWAVPVALDVSSAQGAVAAYLLTAGTTFYLPYRLTRHRTVTDTHRNLSLYGGSRGIVSGLFAGDLVGGDREDGRGSGRARLAGGVVGGAAGGTLGFMAVDRWNPELGDAELWAALGDAGLLVGAATAYLAGPYKEETFTRRDNGFEFTDTRIRSRRVGHALTLAGQGAGLAAGAWLGGRRSYSTGDVSALRSATIAGVQTGASAARLAGVDEWGDAVVGAMLAGGLGGLVAGDRWMGPRGLSTGEGLLVNAAHLAGTATAAGLTYLLVDEIDGNETLLLSASTVGGILGAGLVWRAVVDGAPRRVGSLGNGAPGRFGSISPGTPSPGSGGGATRPDAPAGITVEVHPMGILQGTLLAPRPGIAGAAHGSAAVRTDVPPGWGVGGGTGVGGAGARSAVAPWLTIRF